MTRPVHTGTITEADAEVQQALIRDIMEQDKIPFEQAVDVYIGRVQDVLRSCDRIEQWLKE